MDEAWLESVQAVLDRQTPADSVEHPRVARRFGALDYGAYFDLVLPHPIIGESSPAQGAEAETHLRERLSRLMPSAANDSLPAVTSLSTQFYSVGAIDRLKRWWDIDPDNAMHLTGVSAAELSLARVRIVEAFQRLHQCAPELHDEITALIGEIVIARSGERQHADFGGASSFALWGAMVLNFDAQPDWLRYFQTIVHEAGHNLLFALARKEPLVGNDLDARYGSPLRADRRPMDGIFHAAFVSARESFALDCLLSWEEHGGDLSDEEVAAAEDLLDGSVLAFWNCAETLTKEAELTDLGAAILADCEEFVRSSFLVRETE